MTRLRGAAAALLLAISTPHPAAADPAEPPGAAPPEARDRAVEVSVRPDAPPPRGAFDLRATRAQLEASPRQQTAELLSAVPGFFVDHEDGEGLGNDVYLRGWDLDHGSGIELDVGGLPVNQPVHLLGQGYADLAFVIPEVVTGIHVRQGVSDPRQGDAAIVGSAGLELGVAERGLRSDLSLGSFGQRRLLLVGAPRGEATETFAAIALRETDGFGASRGARSGTANLQARLDPGAGVSLRVFGFGYSVGSEVPGIVREDDVEAGRVSLFGRYPAAAAGQGAEATRLALGAELSAGERHGARVTVTPWVMATGLVVRRNYSGAVETSRLDPRRSGLGDLFESRTEELAGGATARVRPERLTLGAGTTLELEPGAVVRAGETDQRKRLLVPGTLEPWDTRTDAEIHTIDAALYTDAVLERGPLRLSGGPRVDLLALAVDDALARRNPGGSGPGAAV
ncbi:MAG: TonB-dependent receptor plug domain-containing protein, partial [Deltaproteobacteria bacterium]|nr:TonB-dependent receptor plug domain-containing protein [Deltaproteobacteria bacterium]